MKFVSWPDLLSLRNSQRKLFFLVLSFCVFSCYSLTEKEPLNDLLFWGTYKPNLISSLTQRSLHPITVGFAFSENIVSQSSFENFKKSLRFTTNQNLFTQYTHHNGLDFSKQIVIDEDLGVFYDVKVMKEVQMNYSNSKYIQQWRYLIQSQNLDKTNQIDSKQLLSTYLYIALENLESGSTDTRGIFFDEEQTDGISIAIKIINTTGSSNDGYFRISVTKSGRTNSYIPNNSPLEIYKCMVSDYEKNNILKIEDILYKRLSTNLLKGISYLDPKKCQTDSNGAKVFVMQIVSDSPIQILTSYSSSKTPAHTDLLELSESLALKEKEFENRITIKLPIRNLNKYKYDLGEARQIQRYLLSNIFGRIVHQSFQNQNNISNQRSLSILSSRTHTTKIANGFQLNVLCRYSLDLCLNLLESQIDLFQHEYTTILNNQSRNSVSLILPIEYLVDLSKNNNNKTEENKIKIREFLINLQPKLVKWFQMLIKESEMNQIVYINKIYNHWLSKIASIILVINDLEMSKSQIVNEAQKNELKNLNDYIGKSGKRENKGLEEDSQFLHLFVEDLEISPTEKRIFINVLTNSNNTWSNYGIKNSEIDSLGLIETSHTCQNSIRPDLNYFILKKLKSCEDEPESKELYEAIRENLLKTISLNWQIIQNFWEGYDSWTGVGKRCPGLEGLNSLIVLIYSEEY